MRIRIQMTIATRESSCQARRMTPPPLPPRRPVRRAEFREEKKVRLGNVNFDHGLVEATHRKAEAWINRQEEIEIVQNQTFHSSLTGITVVWYR